MRLGVLAGGGGGRQAVRLTCPVFIQTGTTVELAPGSTLIAEPWTPSLTYVDTDVDGTVSPSELREAMARRGAPPRAAAALLRSLDANGDCAVDASEWSRLGTAETGGPSRAYLLGAALVVERGARLIARGSDEAPITLRMATANDTDAPLPDGGWGGLLLMGKAPVAEGAEPSGACWAGVPVSPAPYGGTDPRDSSGVLRYVRVWHGQRGLALHGVGSGTTVEQCEVVASASDGVLLHGGAVDVRRLSVLSAARAAFHARGGYQGRGQYLFALLGAEGSHGLVTGAGEDDPEDTYATSPPLRPRFFSITLLGGGVNGSTAARAGSLMHLVSGPTEGGAFGNAVLVHGSGDGVRLHGESTPAQAHPPPPPLDGPGYRAQVAYVGTECGLQHPNGLDEGEFLGVYPSADACAPVAAAYNESHGNCSHFQMAQAFPAWGCLCCWRAVDGRAHSQWAVYTPVLYAPPPSPPPLDARPSQSPLPPANPPWAGAYLSSSALVVADVANRSFAVSALGSGPFGPEAATLQSVEASPGLFEVDAECLTRACLARTAGHCRNPFDPLPSPGGHACRMHLDDPLALEPNATHFFEAVACAGAFASPDYKANWLAGWSSLFPHRLGEDPQHPADMVIGLGATTMTLHTALLANDPAVARRRAYAHARNPLTFDPFMCAETAFAPEVAPATPIFWVRLYAPHSGVATLSTCSTQEGGGFDTDLAVFRRPATDPCALEQIACNGDGYGQAGCRNLYSSLALALEEGSTYLVAIKAHNGFMGDRVNLTTLLSAPPDPPGSPPPAPPPARPLEANGTALLGDYFQLRIDDARPGEFIHFDLDATVTLHRTVRVPELAPPPPHRALCPLAVCASRRLCAPHRPSTFCVVVARATLARSGGHTAGQTGRIPRGQPDADVGRIHHDRARDQQQWPTAEQRASLLPPL